MFKILKQIIKSNFKRKFYGKQTLNADQNNYKSTLPLNSIKIHYINEKGKELKKTDVFYGPKNTKTNYIIPSFKDYVIYNIKGDLKYFMDNNEVFIEYQKLYGKPLNIMYIDIQNHLLLKAPEIKIGKLNTLYKINPPKINGYKNTSHDGNLQGTFGNKVQSIVLYYAKKDWLKITYENFYIKTSESTKVFNDADLSKFVRIIPENSIWKVFAKLQKGNSNWLNIGANQWIVDNSFIRINYPFGQKLEDTNNWKLKKVNFWAFLKSKRTQVFNYPGGNIINYAIKDKKIKITLSILDNKNVHWYEINNLYYIESNSIKKL